MLGEVCIDTHSSSSILRGMLGDEPEASERSCEHALSLDTTIDYLEEIDGRYVPMTFN